MHKSVIREYKCHYTTRWEAMKHNLKHPGDVVSLHDKLIMKQLVDGPTLFNNIIGLQHIGTIDLAISDARLNYQYNYKPAKYKNLVLLNDPQFKYKTLDQILLMIVEMATTNLDLGACLVVGFNYQFVKFNRLKYSYDDAIAEWLDKLQQNRLKLKLNLTKKLPNTNPYGDNIFILNYA